MGKAVQDAREGTITACRGVYKTKGKSMMNEKEIQALVSLLLYINNDGWQYRDSDRLVEILSDYVKGLYSTGNIK